MNALLFAPPVTDLFMRTLSYIVGPLIHTVTGIGQGTTTGVSKLLADFAGLVMYFVGFWVAYIVFVGILRTAHEGEWMGRKWSTKWIMLRTGIAAMLLLPIVSGGYDAGQAVMVYLEGNAVGAADQAWDLAAKYVVKDPVGGVQVEPSQLRDIAAGIMTAQVCEDAVNYNIRTYPLAAAAAGGQVSASQGLALGTDVGMAAANALSNIAGFIGSGATNEPDLVKYDSINWSVPNLQTAADMGVPTTDMCGDIIYPVGASGNNTEGQIQNAIFGENATLIPDLKNALRPLSLAIEKNQNPTPAAYDTAIDNYANIMAKTAENSASTLETKAEQGFLAKIHAQGIATAGDWWWRMTHFSAVAQDALNNIGSYSNFGGTAGDLGSLFSGRYDGAMVRLTHFINDYGDSYLAPSKAGTGFGAVHTPGMLGGVATWTSQISARAALFAGREPRNVNPILGIMNEGYVAEGMGTAMFAALEGVDAVKGAAKGAAEGDTGMVPGVSIIARGFAGAAKPMAQLLKIGAEVLIALGLFLSVWVPLIPYFVWITAIFSVLILFIVAIFATPLWLAFHISPEGHEVVGLGQRGWMMLNTILLTPLLMIAGLIVGTGVLYGAAWLLNQTIGGAVVSTFVNGSGGFMGPFDAIGELVLYIVLLVTVVTTSFSLIHKFPEWVLEWIGAPKNDRTGEPQSEKIHDTGRKAKEGIQGGLNASPPNPQG
ncbi:DotA/TraY family protein [Acidithiobacillus ferriphilus]|uniref:DotA/TraY family protein n=1 Tax=Acidithiobacillus ferriphilus TaxID=1689834 RepID=UPI001C0791C9|nr:DotA/TraY family protein [Acidithiobacillus ferriphilus]MBU2845485.1 DotA/TraY family protein [Acidithiobacillus ferriphilus]MEB8475734.1 DotA/TraY family protein [Acidithiobacillus ferriphilus]